MTAAQALAAPTTSVQARPQSGATARDARDSSFEDTLDTASKSSDAGPRASGKTEPRTDTAEGSRETTARGEDAPNDQEAVVAPSDPRESALSLAAMLQAAASQGAVAEAGSNDEATPVPSLDVDAAVAMPTEAGEAIDAEQLLALIKAGGPAGPSRAERDAAVPFTVTVTGEETHLALDQTAADVAGALAQLDEAGDLAAAFPRGAGDVAEASRAAASTDPDTPSLKHGETVPLQIDGDQGGALADQGIANGQGRQEGQGQSNAGQPNGAGFASALSATRTNAANDATSGTALHEPVSDQIAAGVRAELRADGIGEASSDGKVRVLHLELKPANLGTVTVRMELKDNVITLHLEAQRSDTLAVLEREREALANTLSRAGYNVDGITAQPQSEGVRSSMPTGGAQSDTGASYQGSGNPGGQGPSQSSGQEGERRGQSFSEGADTFGARDGNDDRGSSIKRGTDALYV